MVRIQTVWVLETAAFFFYPQNQVAWQVYPVGITGGGIFVVEKGV
jgi:hypothetical protein